QNQNTGATGGCEVEPDTATAVGPLGAGYLIGVLLSKNIAEAAESGDDEGVTNVRI
ncbi:hypothetical protein A2U01_0061753, partial [Trifolium medium]|nr:hypothetical protein [Trifolium medium]